MQNINEFDCRNYISVGDKIKYLSMKACDTGAQVDRSLMMIPYYGIVTDVYNNFVIVKLKRIRESVNRWDIISINDKHVGNNIGHFISFDRKENNSVQNDSV